MLADDAGLLASETATPGWPAACLEGAPMQATDQVMRCPLAIRSGLTRTRIGTGACIGACHHTHHLSLVGGSWDAALPPGLPATLRAVPPGLPLPRSGRSSAVHPDIVLAVVAAQCQLAPCSGLPWAVCTPGPFSCLPWAVYLHPCLFGGVGGPGAWAHQSWNSSVQSKRADNLIYLQSATSEEKKIALCRRNRWRTALAATIGRERLRRRCGECGLIQRMA